MLAVALTLAGSVLFFYKWQALGFPLAPDGQTDTWIVEVQARFDAGPGPIRLNLHIPALTPGFSVVDENFVSRGFGFTTRYVGGGRQVQWAIRRASGQQSLFYRAVVYREPGRVEGDTTPGFPTVPRLEEPYQTAMEMLVEEVGRQSADPATFATELLTRLGRPGADQNVDLLLGPSPSDFDRARVATTLLAAQRIPARVMRGLTLEDRTRRAEMVPWLEVHDGERWLYFDPRSGEMGLPRDFLVWWRGEDPLYVIDGGRNVDVDISVQRSLADPLIVAQRRAEAWGSRITDFSLFALPIQTQAVYGVLLLIPVGALLVVLMRNFVGVQTFGTFMPVLIALAFRETRLLGGVLLFTLIVALGLSFRFYLEHLRLLLIPRLAAVLIIVVLLMLAVSIVTHQLGIDMGLSVALFPMVILTMTIERMSIVWEERGSHEAIQQGLGSLAVAALAYLVMGISLVEHLVFVFPELLLIVLALTLLAGRYTGYRLVELVRFRQLAG